MSRLDQNGNYKDIVGELRRTIKNTMGVLYSRRIMLAQAADEITRLRSELANARNAALEDAIDAIDEYRETIPTDKFGPKAWPTVGGIKDAIRRALKAGGRRQ